MFQAQEKQQAVDKEAIANRNLIQALFDGDAEKVLILLQLETQKTLFDNFQLIGFLYVSKAEKYFENIDENKVNAAHYSGSRLSTKCALTKLHFAVLGGNVKNVALLVDIGANARKKVHHTTKI